MNLTLITVNYNCARLTVELLRSLERQTRGDFQVIVVDNDSVAEDRAILGEYAASSPLRLDVIYSDTNRGFSGGNNLAIRKALAQGCEWFLLINPDTTVGTDFIASLALPDRPSIVGLPLREGERTAYAGIVRWLQPTLAHLYNLPTTSSHLFYAIGAGMLVHRNVFNRIGLLDERYFLYFEDADLSLRARCQGIPVRFVTGPVITHGVSQSTKALGSPLLLRYHMRNALLFNWNNGPWYVRTALPFWSFFVMVKQLVKLLLMPSRRQASKAIAAGIVDFYARKSGKIDTHWD